MTEHTIDYSQLPAIQKHAYAMALGTGSLALEFLRMAGMNEAFQIWAARLHPEITESPDRPLEPDALKLMDDLLAMQVLILMPASPATGQDEPQVAAAATRAFTRQAEKLAALAVRSVRETEESARQPIPRDKLEQGLREELGKVPADGWTMTAELDGQPVDLTEPPEKS